MKERIKQDNRSIESDATLDADDASCPHVVEMAPFPTLSSLNEITTTLSRRSQYANKQSTKGNPDEKDTKEEEIVLEPLNEGLTSPGWLVVLSTFLVNFSVFGYCFWYIKKKKKFTQKIKKERI
ncbi:hypothetical protein BCR42DRAFT_19691 [Absidia repens]|uniref:Uncharacterized protein n=1 Tax=Absidia repens TaxID=90262 RepID=A0A1X2J2T7_9FUNG|nr:hypothetical protein BCR42DRAFT_19691 [Absidia repens]